MVFGKSGWEVVVAALAVQPQLPRVRRLRLRRPQEVPLRPLGEAPLPQVPEEGLQPVLS